MRNTIYATLIALGTLVVPHVALAIGKCGSGPRATCVVDGDTFWFEGEKVRAMGYDTPEPMTNLCGGSREKQLADLATQRFVELFNTSRITMERRGRDRYGRTLAIIRADGDLVADILISEGLARRYPDGREFWCY
ncbi:thermonuclease family protein [Maritimibacter sp. DP4N28-5]|uniref:Thermonuclease family protein n=1 Tax=Maritimibacter dapengensis TaxID=2836868 RepID=A0ABS6T561_9RHOB|nr:thermonuclease family protein [Maritimibacter dapengensis]